MKQNILLILCVIFFLAAPANAMVCLDNTDTLEGGASVTNVVDFTVHGLVGTTFVNIAQGQLSDTDPSVLYTAGAAISVVSVIYVNTHSAAVTVNLYLDPANAGTPRRLIPKNLSLGVGYSMYFDGAKCTVMDATGAVLQSIANAITSPAVIADNTVVRGDGGARGVQDTGITVDDSDNMAIPGTLTVKPDATNEVFQVNDGSMDFSDGNAGTAGTLTIDASGHWSYNKSLFVSGTLLGAVDIISDDNSLAAAQCYGSLNKLNGAETTTLPAAVAGMSVALYSDDATVKTIDPNGTDHIWLNGADLGAGASINSPGAVGDFIVLVAFAANNWYSMGQSGTWVITP